MPNRYRLFFTFLGVLILLIFGLRLVGERISFLEEPPRTECEQNDPECMIALGECLTFSDVDLYGLEQLPGMQSSLAEELLTHRKRILEDTKLKSSDSRFESLMIIRGIGEKRAQLYARHLCEFQ